MEWSIYGFPRMMFRNWLKENIKKIMIGEWNGTRLQLNCDDVENAGDHPSFWLHQHPPPQSILLFYLWSLLAFTYGVTHFPAKFCLFTPFCLPLSLLTSNQIFWSPISSPHFFYNKSTTNYSNTLLKLLFYSFILNIIHFKISKLHHNFIFRNILIN